MVSNTNLSLNNYVRRRNGVPLGGKGALREMLRRSLGAKSTTVFWQYWNPIFGYYLGKFVYRPVRSLGLSDSLATIATFAVSGAVHDVAATLITRDLVYVCTPWFVFMALGLLLSRALRMDLSRRSWGVRAAAHVGYVGVCLALSLLVRSFISA